MSTIEAPYNFVPVSDIVVRADGLPSQDAPFEDGLCGEIALTLVAETPLLVAGEQAREPQNPDQPREKCFARGSDDRPEIPGSSIKGMVRAVVEIASFSAMRLIEDRRFGLRDLAGPSADSYRRKFQHEGDGEGKSLGGWLRRAGLEEGGGWVIEPCRVERYAHDRFVDAFANAFRTLQRKQKIDEKQAPQIYAAWKQAHGAEWMKALRVGEGELVFTGIPSPKKRKEFVFTGTGAAPIPVPEEVWSGFVDVHENQEKPSATWMWWKKRLGLPIPKEQEDSSLPYDRVGLIPVFYLHDGVAVTSLGLAQMFKMSGQVSTRAALPPAHRPDGIPAPDIAESLFGRVEEEGEQSFRGRVAFSAGRLLDDNYNEMSAKWGLTVASAPKPGFHPAYLRQYAPPSGKKRSYVTWVDEGARLRGWKRYPAQERAEEYKPPAPPPKSGARNQSALRPIVPLKGGEPLRFTTTLRFHNLRPFELGALLWALDFGGDAAARHALGMGKPYGWGRVRFETGAARLALNDSVRTAPGLVTCCEAFARRMTEAVPGWEESDQIRALRTMARPAADPVLRYMTLDPDRRINEFQDARNAGAVLPGPGGIENWLPSAPRGGASAPTRRTQTLFRKGDEVRDHEMGDFGTVIEDQSRPGADVLVEFDGAQDWMPATAIERV